MFSYTSTPIDFYDDFIEHKNTSFKYIERYKGPNGKWYYRYKSNSQKKAFRDRKRPIKVENKLNAIDRGASGSKDGSEGEGTTNYVNSLTQARQRVKASKKGFKFIPSKRKKTSTQKKSSNYVGNKFWRTKHNK